ncbi:MAG: YggS family pyridoxal phosphate-dependent enzyme [Lysobacteraceae bacterium]
MNPPPDTTARARLDAVLARVERAARQAARPVRLLAVSKFQSAQAVASLTACGQIAFGENYVQEGIAKQRELEATDATGLEWHLIGPLQSNKAELAARHFDWVQSVDRAKLVPLLARGRSAEAAPLNLLIQVNVDDEASKSGCAPDEVSAMAELIASHPTLTLRGLMAIPAPYPDISRRRAAFARMRELFDALCATHPSADTLSMGMSDDFEMAIEEGATMVRVGTALFGPRET